MGAKVLGLEMGICSDRMAFMEEIRRRAEKSSGTSRLATKARNNGG